MRTPYTLSAQALNFQHDLSILRPPTGVFIIVKDLTSELATRDHKGIFGKEMPDIRKLAARRLELGSHTIDVYLTTKDRYENGHAALREVRSMVFDLAKKYNGTIKVGTGEIYDDLHYVSGGPEMGLGWVDFEHSSLACEINVVFRLPDRSGN